jgi:transposase
LKFALLVFEFVWKFNDKQSKLQNFLKREQADKETGEIIDTMALLSLDMDKIQMDMHLMGYYTVMTSEIHMPDQEIIDKYHGLSRIEDSFRTIKSDLEGRPVFVQTEEHINAHFLICFIALTMIRLIQYKILIHLGKETKNVRNWEVGLSADRIKTALGEFSADSLPGAFFRLTKPSQDRQLITDAFAVNANLKIPTIHDLKQLKYAFDKLRFM